jgi:uncharacterized protein (TIGR03032 family)
LSVEIFAQAVAAHGAGALEAAEQGYRGVLAQNPDHSGALANLGRLARQRGDLAEAIALYERAAEGDAPAEVHFNLGCALWDSPDRKICFDSILASFDRAIALRADFREAWVRRAQVVAATDDPKAAFAAWNAAATALPDDSALAIEAGKAALDAGLFEPAVPLLRRGAQDPARRDEAETRLASALMDMNDGAGAIRLLKATAERNPHSATVQFNLAIAYRKTHNYLKALEGFKKTTNLDPADTLVGPDIANCLVNVGQTEQAFKIFDEVLSGGGPKESLSSALMGSLYNPDRSADDIAKVHANAMRHHARPDWVRPAHRRRPGALRVGFLSADFQSRHPVALFALPLLRRLADHQVEPTVYLSQQGGDDTARQLLGVAKTRSVKALQDAAAAQLIAEDELDVLLDLSGHTANNRLGILTFCPAPVQACFVGYPSTTGHPCIDFVIGDGMLIPPEHEGAYSETVARLPNSFLCFDPPADMPDPAFPALGDRVRFGSLNHLPKLNPQVIDLWARVLAAAPNTDLVLKCGAFSEVEVRHLISARFAARGVDPARLILEGPEGFASAMRAYHRIDIALDPFPYGGGTTTCQALFMGTPVVTLAGDRFSARMGVSLLTAAGHPEWIAQDKDAYVEIAVQLAADPVRLRKTRRALAGEIRATPLCDIGRYTADVVALLHQIADVAPSAPPTDQSDEQNVRRRKSHLNWPEAPVLRNGPDLKPQERFIMSKTEVARSSDSPALSAADAADAAGAKGPRMDITTSRQFTSFLTESNAALAISTYQAGMVLIIGIDPETGKLWIFNRHVERPMGIASDRRRLAVAALTQIVTFVDGHHGTPTEGQDPVFVPQLAHFTGDLDVHDIAFDAAGDIVFVNTLFSCLATVSPTHSFRALWKPRFISRLAAEDRCHLNGLAMRDGAPAFVTAVSTSDIADGWREHRRDGGVVIDVTSGEIAATDLSMPHSPRWHDGKLWLLNAGTGELGTVDPATGSFTAVAFCPGYLRGLTFIGRYAIVGASEPRENHTFGGLALQERLDRENISPRCGVFVIDTVTGDVVHWLRITGVVTELFDIAVIPEARKPSLIGFRSDEIRRVVSIDDGLVQG